MPFPPPPTGAIDWDDIGFRVREVNGHVESHYTVESGEWSAPEFVKDPYLKIHGLAPGLNYGQQAYEGMKAFRTPDDQIAIFRPDQNASRLVTSASCVSVPPVPHSHFLNCVHLATSLNAEFVPPHRSGAALYIRPLLFGSSAKISLDPADEYIFCVFVLPVGVYHGSHSVDALIMEDFDRAAPQGTGASKIGGNYAPVMRWTNEAKKKGFGITLHLDSQTRTVIDEFSTSGFVGVKEDGGQYTVVVPDSKQVIKSVTSDSVCEIAKSFGWNVECRPITYDELSSFAEVMAVGTAAALLPIKSITMISKKDKILYRDGKDEYGPVCLKLLATLQGIQQGKIKDTFGWLQYVGEPKDFPSKPSTNGLESLNGVEDSVDNLP